MILDRDEGLTLSNMAQPRELLESSLLLEDEGYFEIVAEFAVRLKVRIGRMWDALSATEMQELFDLVHWLKGTGGTVGFPDLSHSAEKLELAIQGGKLEVTRMALTNLTELSQRVHVPNLTISNDAKCSIQ